MSHWKQRRHAWAIQDPDDGTLAGRANFEVEADYTSTGGLATAIYRRKADAVFTARRLGLTGAAVVKVWVKFEKAGS